MYQFVNVNLWNWSWKFQSTSTRIEKECLTTFEQKIKILMYKFVIINVQTDACHAQWFGEGCKKKWNKFLVKQNYNSFVVWCALCCENGV